MFELMFDRRVLHPIRYGFLIPAVVGMILLAIGCGGSSTGPGPNPGPGPGPTATTVTQVKMGDAPVDRVIAFEVSIASPIVFKPSGGGANVNVSIGANRLEMSHMSAKLEPLALFNVSQGTYSSAAITITNPEVTFLDNAGVQHHIQSTASQNFTVSFSPPFTIGANATVLNVDLSIANSLASDVSGNITGFNFSANSFTIGTKAIAAENEQEDDDGELEDVTGLVTAVSGTNFTMNVGQTGAQLQFGTDTTTQFSDGVTNVASSLNQIVKVEGITKSDGSLFAKEVEGLESQNGADMEGLVTNVSGNPANSLDIIAQDGIGSGMDDTKVGVSFTADVSGATNYKVDMGNIDTSGLGGIPGLPNFPFDNTTIMAGQRVEVETANSLPAASGTLLVDNVKLQQQALTGTVSNFIAAGAAASFDLNLAPDGSSYLTLLSSQTLVHVFQQPGTDNKFGAISNGSAVRVRGLLFWTGTTFNLIARRITP